MNNLTLAEAIRLGSLTVKPKPHLYFTTSADNKRVIGACALGMASLALDQKAKNNPFVSTWLYQKFPVLAYAKVKIPCDCHPYGYGSTFPLSSGITHLFDAHVAQSNRTAKPWTLDQLCEWVAGVEEKFVKSKKRRAAAKEKTTNDTLDHRTVTV